ncbi:hypothetical protein EVAR_73603_1, partial [Eumeta japonica]
MKTKLVDCHANSTKTDIRAAPTERRRSPSNFDNDVFHVGPGFNIYIQDSRSMEKH